MEARLNDLAISTIELCSGVGMLGEGLRAGFGYLGLETRTCVHVEREAYAAAVLVARMEEGSLDAAPVWPDLCTFDARAWRGKIDCVIAGFPCQDLSVAGKRAGLDGKRSGLFFEVVRIAADCGAWLMLLENVSGIASATASVMDAEEGELDERAASRVVGELADCGWNSEWITLSASDVGASHGRARWFCLAWKLDNSDGAGKKRPGRTKLGAYSGREDVDDTKRSERRPPCSRSIGRQQRDDGRRSETHSRTGIASEVLANPSRNFGDECRWEGRSRWRVCEAGNELADAAIVRREERPWVDGAETTVVGATGGEFGAFNQRGAMADPRWPRRQGDEQSAAYEPDGRTDGRSKNHADQLPNFVMMNYSPLGHPIRDGQQSSNNPPGSRRHLNPLFAAWLMGWPSTWAIAEPHASSAQETELWRCKLQQRLSSLLGDQDSFKEAA